MKKIQVVAAIIRDKDKLFSAKRNYGNLKGFWEFPGGIVNIDEQPEIALQRELREELNAEIKISEYFTSIEYDYPDFHMKMDCYICTTEKFELNEAIHSKFKWLTLSDLDSVNWLEADKIVVNRLKIYLSKNILVSACLLGDNCKYNGGNNYNQNVVDLVKNKNVIKVCPEILANLPLPRKPVEISNDKIITKDKVDMTKLYMNSAKKAMQDIADKEIDLAILKANSPTCGSKYIYDGTFSHKLIEGNGIFAQMIKDKGILVISERDI